MNDLLSNYPDFSFGYGTIRPQGERVVPPARVLTHEEVTKIGEQNLVFIRGLGHVLDIEIMDEHLIILARDEMLTLTSDAGGINIVIEILGTDLYGISVSGRLEARYAESKWMGVAYNHAVRALEVTGVEGMDIIQALHNNNSDDTIELIQGKNQTWFVTKFYDLEDFTITIGINTEVPTSTQVRMDITPIDEFGEDRVTLVDLKTNKIVWTFDIPRELG